MNDTRSVIRSVTYFVPFSWEYFGRQIFSFYLLCLVICFVYSIYENIVKDGISEPTRWLRYERKNDTPLFTFNFYWTVGTSCEGSFPCLLVVHTITIVGDKSENELRLGVKAYSQMEQSEWFTENLTIKDFPSVLLFSHFFSLEKTRITKHLKLKNNLPVNLLSHISQYNLIV